MERRETGTADIHYYSDRLKHKLNNIKNSHAVVFEAPSGYGKTTAVRDYLKNNLQPSSEVHWFTVADEIPEVGYRRLCRIIEKIDSYAGKRLLQMGFPNAITIGEICEVIRSIQCNHDSWLVIDNFQSLNTGMPPSFLTALLEHGSTDLHIIIITQMLNRDVHTSIAGHGFLHITDSDLRLDAKDVMRYYALAGTEIFLESALDVIHITEGWIIAVYLQLKAFQETGSFSDTAIISLMEHLIWEKLTEEQQVFLLWLSPFNTITIGQACVLAHFEAVPDYALEALQSPFIHYERTESQYEFHAILYELLAQKRRERGTAFERECFTRAGDLCRNINRNAEAIAFYWKIKDCRRILSLDFSLLVFDEIDGIPFSVIAAELAQNCSAEIRKDYPLSMLRVAWALKAWGMDAAFSDLLDELELILGQDLSLQAEWLLLSAYRFFPDINKMMPSLKEAALLFNGKCSRVILPDVPWCFGDYSQLSVFHRKPGEADLEACALEEFISLYSKLTGGHGSGADVLFRMELAHYRGSLTEAEILAYKAIFIAEANRQSIIQLGATMHLCEIAVEKSNYAEWQSALNSMENAASIHGNALVRIVLETLHGLLLNELEHHDRIINQLKNLDQVEQFPLSVKYNALFVHVCYLMHKGEYMRMIGAAQAVKDSLYSYSFFGDAFFSLLIAIGYIRTGNKDHATENLEYAIEMLMPDGFTYFFAVHHWLLKGLSEELIGKKFPKFLPRYLEIKERFIKGFNQLHDALLPDSLPNSLTVREREIALLAAKGLKNSEIAEKLFVTENTVRTHLHAVFQKLDIDRRSKLAEKLL